MTFFFWIKRGWLAWDSLLGTNSFFPSQKHGEGVFDVFWVELEVGYGLVTRGGFLRTYSRCIFENPLSSRHGLGFQWGVSGSEANRYLLNDLNGVIQELLIYIFIWSINVPSWELTNICSQNTFDDFPFPVCWDMFSRFIGGQFFTTDIWVFPKIVVPQHGWFIMEIPVKMDDLGVPPFSETSKWTMVL